jgi:hypothetical protein
VVRIAPRISLRLLRELERLDDPTVSIAETCRRIGAAADRLGLPRPSYQRLRVLVHEHRRLRERTASTGEVALDVMLRVRPPQSFVDHLDGASFRRK